MSKRSRKSAVLPWLRLIRLPNLFTVPGDVCWGACFSMSVTGHELSFWSLLDVCFCSILLYCMGTIQNDLRDIVEDRRWRPERPLPSKEIPVGFARLVATLCFFVSLFLALFNGMGTVVTVLALGLCITLYNWVFKKTLVGGSLNMGLCRGLNVLLGASVVGFSPWLLLPVAAATAYIMAVTWLADGENRRQIPGLGVFIPGAVMLASWILALPFQHSEQWGYGCLASLFCLLWALALSFLNGLAVYSRSVGPDRMHRLIGQYICCLVPWQASWVCFALPGDFWRILFLAILFWLASRLLGKSISHS